MLRTHRHGLNSNRTTPMNKTSLFVEFFHYAYDFFFFFIKISFFCNPVASMILTGFHSAPSMLDVDDD